MVEPLLAGIVLGLVPVTITGLFVTAYLQFRRGDQLSVLRLTFFLFMLFLLFKDNILKKLFLLGIFS